jgi:hypothetical protein
LVHISKWKSKSLILYLKNSSFNFKDSFDKKVNRELKIRKIENYIKVAKLFISNFLFIFIFFVLVFIFIGISLLSFFIYNQISSQLNTPLCKWSIYLDSGFKLFWFVTLLFLMVLLLLDQIIHHIKSRNINIFDYFIYDDPFRFRIQLHLTNYISIASSFLLLIMMVILYAIDFSEESLKIINFINTIFWTFLELGLIFTLSIFPIFLSLYWEIKRKTKKNINNELTSCLKNPEVLKLFKEYCKKEWSNENLQLYEEIIIFQTTIKFEMKIELFNSIVKSYILRNSPYEVNINESMSKEKLINLYKSNDDEKKALNDVFDYVLDEILINLQDTFFRFKNSNMYHKYSSYKDFTDNLLEKLL